MKSENAKKCFHPYLAVNTHRMEKWLSKQSHDGWRLVRSRGWVFTFMRAAPAEREYFSFTLPWCDKNSKFSNNYVHAERHYAAIQHKIDSYIVFEVDPEKKNPFYSFLIAERARYYRKFYGILSLPFALLSAVFICFRIWLLVPFFGIFAVHSLLSFIIALCHIHRLRKASLFPDKF